MFRSFARTMALLVALVVVQGLAISMTASAQAAETRGAQPSFTAQVSAKTVKAGGRVFDNVSLSNMPMDLAPTLKWRLLGPVKPVNNSCAAVNWSQAPVVARGDFLVPADMVMATPAVRVTKTGCYSYALTLSATPWSPRVGQGVGVAAQSFRVTSR